MLRVGRHENSFILLAIKTAGSAIKTSESVGLERLFFIYAKLEAHMEMFHYERYSISHLKRLK